MTRAPTDRLRRHWLRPSTGGVGSGAETHRRRATAMPRPRSGAPPGALERPPREAGARVARGHLWPPAAGTGGPERATAALQPAPPPASCSAAPQQHGRLARSEAARRHHSAQATQPSHRSSCTWRAARCTLSTAAVDAVRMVRRRGQGWSGHGGLERLTFCASLLTPTQASRSQLRRDPVRPRRHASDAAMLGSCTLLPLPAAAKAAKKIKSMQPTAAAPETASPAAASKQQRRRAGSLRPPHEACTAAGAGSLPKLAARAAPGGRGGGGGGGPTAGRHAP